MEVKTCVQSYQCLLTTTDDFMKRETNSIIVVFDQEVVASLYILYKDCL